MNNEILFTQAAFAKYRDVSRMTVTRWKQQGRLVFVGRKIDRIATDKLLADSGIVRRKHSEPEALPDIAEGLEALLDRTGLITKVAAEQLKENYLALLRRLEFEQKAGKLVEVEPLKKSIFELWRRERDAWLNFPTRVAALMASELCVDQNELAILLEKYINEHLAERSEQPRILLP